MGERIGFAREVSALKTRIFASIALWLAAVASVAGIAWLAIDTAGHQVTAAPISAPLATLGPNPQTPSATLSPTSRPSSTGPKGAATRAAPKSSPSPSGSRRVRGNTGSTSVTGTYSTRAGRVRVSCRGWRITLDDGYAQPSSGWSVRMLSGGPQKVLVLFESEGQRDLLVVAFCSDGRPQFDQNWIEPGSPPADDDNDHVSSPSPTQ
jgi:hypothetical protein